MIDKKPYEGVLDDENLFIKLPKPLAPNTSAEISLEYSVILPSAQFTGYGIGKNNTLLKYFSWFQTVLTEIISLKNITKI